jgi:hypothetical protein
VSIFFMLSFRLEEVRELNLGGGGWKQVIVADNVTYVCHDHNQDPNKQIVRSEPKGFHSSAQMADYIPFTF